MHKQHSMTQKAEADRPPAACNLYEFGESHKNSPGLCIVNGPGRGTEKIVLDACRLQRWSLLPLRLIVGYGFMAHGYAKLVRGPDSFAAILQALGVPQAHLMSSVTIIIELAGGAAILLGAFVGFAILPMAAVLVTAMLTVHLPYGFSSIKLQAITAHGAQFGPPGYEVDLLYLACMATLVLGGPGPFAMDGLIRKRSNIRATATGFGKPHARHETHNSPTK
jgi:putative oxidoreductase